MVPGTSSALSHVPSRRSSVVSGILGFEPDHGPSTGWDPAARRDYETAVAAAAEMSGEVIELSALSTGDLPILAAYLDSPAAESLGSFRHVSVHGPAKHLPVGEVAWVDLCGRLARLPEEVSGSIIMHPDTLSTAPAEPLMALGARLVLENMDCRKRTCRTAEEMVPVFEAFPDAGFCLDVAHVWTVDATLRVGEELLEAFGGRLREVHVSGIEPDGQHRVTVPEDLHLYKRLLESCDDVPWVFESPLLLNAGGSN